MTNTLLQKVNVGFASALAVLVAIAFIASYSADQLVDETRLVQRTHDTLAGVGEILRLVLDAESAQRGFALTSDPAHLHTHGLAVNALPTTVKRARVLVQDSPAQRERLATLHPLLQQRLALLDESLKLHQAGPAPEGQTLLTGRGAELTGKIRRLIAEMLDEERDRLQRQSAVCEARAHKTVGIIAATSLLAVVLVVVASGMVQRDLAARQLAEAARLEAEARAHRAFTLLDETRDGLFLFDLETLRLTYVNQGAVEQIGRAREELLGMTALVLAPEFNADTFYAKATPVIHGTEPTLTFTTRLRRKAGPDLPVEIVLQCISVPGGPRSFVALVRDITDRQQAAAQIRQLNTELEQRVGDLAARIVTYSRRG